MKKTIYMMAAALSVLGMAACSGNKTCNGDKACGKCTDGDRKELYTGVLPSADTDGIRYTLSLEYDDDNPNKGDYDLIETYLVGDSTAVTGYSDDKSFKSEGDFSVMKKDGKSYLKLVLDVKDSAVGSSEGPTYFLVESDSTIVLVNSDLEVSQAPGLNYTLKLSK